MNKLSLVKRACALLIACVATAIVLQAQTFGVLHRFNGTDGASPFGGPIQYYDGNLYGTTATGGVNTCAYGYSCGTIFRMTPDGTLATLHSFDGTDGEYPTSALLEASDGSFYGTTSNGGVSSSCSSPYGCGTVFEFTAGGVLTTLHSFNGVDGFEPNGIIRASDGNFYGTTSLGGTYGGQSQGGTVFKITPSGTLTVLYNFCSRADCADGSTPFGSVLVQGGDGDLYGITDFGGALNAGTVFKITTAGTLTTLYNFGSQDADGLDPEGGLVEGSDGNFYGTATSGGGNYSCPAGCGTVFKITPTGAMTTVHSFNGTDGEGPEGGLIQASDGNFYGTTLYGGSSNYGTVFEITPAGTLTTLHNFRGTDGSFPIAPLVQDTNGNFYGTTEYGSNDTCFRGCGTAFVLSTGLASFVETQPNHGKPGRVIQILGSNLGGASSVTFNGTPAVFKVVSKSLIGAVVPAGATTGMVQVTTPSGVLSSNVPFKVTQ